MGLGGQGPGFLGWTDGLCVEFVWYNFYMWEIVWVSMIWWVWFFSRMWCKCCSAPPVMFYLSLSHCEHIWSTALLDAGTDVSVCPFIEHSRLFQSDLPFLWCKTCQFDFCPTSRDPTSSIKAILNTLSTEKSLQDHITEPKSNFTIRLTHYNQFNWEQKHPFVLYLICSSVVWICWISNIYREYITRHTHICYEASAPVTNPLCCPE